MTKRTSLIVAVVIAAVALIAVAFLSTMKLVNDTTTDKSSTKTSTFNDADVSFAQGMIPHHQQAVTMADLALRQSQHQEVRALATQIRAAQQPEIETMQGWLKAWGKPVQPPSNASMPGMDHGSSTSMTMSGGMMSDADMNRLSTLTGAAFDRAFLSGMIVHHQGAIAMAQTERSNGAFPDAKHMAEAIISSQQAEIDHMNQLLTTL